ncbi:MAG: hypothetical protein AB1540_05135 [Bdellovibrionota bacterium]
MADDIKSQISEAMKKIVLTGVGTIFLTEETIRSYLSEMKLPKELWAGFLENTQKTKTEFLNTFAKEAAQVLSRVDLADEMKKLFSGNKVRITIELEVEKKSGLVGKPIKTPEPDPEA